MLIEQSRKNIRIAAMHDLINIIGVERINTVLLPQPENLSTECSALFVNYENHNIFFCARYHHRICSKPGSDGLEPCPSVSSKLAPFPERDCFRRLRFLRSSG